MGRRMEDLCLKDLQNQNHRELVELVYYMPSFEQLILYFYIFIASSLKNEGYLNYTPRRIQNMVNRFLDKVDEERKRKEEEKAANAPKLTEEERMKRKALSDAYSDLLEYSLQIDDVDTLRHLSEVAKQCCLDLGKETENCVCDN